MNRISWLILLSIAVLCSSCSSSPKGEPKGETKLPAPVVYEKVNPATAGVLTGTVRFTGPKPARKAIDMDEDPACVKAHKGHAFDESVVVNRNGALSNVFVYIKSGLEGKKFETPSVPITIDQNGCWFQPRVMGIQTNQTLKVTNSDPVTHNIHPIAQLNREWNHSQSGGDPPLARRFVRPEVMIRVKCNIHNWMRAFIGVLDHPYFAVTGADGSFEIKNVPPGEYTVEAWQEKLGTQEQKITVAPSGAVKLAFAFKGN
jgi:plastocyanin